MVDEDDLLEDIVDSAMSYHSLTKEAATQFAKDNLGKVLTAMFEAISHTIEQADVSKYEVDTI